MRVRILSGFLKAKQGTIESLDEEKQVANVTLEPLAGAITSEEDYDNLEVIV